MSQPAILEVSRVFVFFVQNCQIIVEFRVSCSGFHVLCEKDVGGVCCRQKYIGEVRNSRHNSVICVESTSVSWL